MTRSKGIINSKVCIILGSPGCLHCPLVGLVTDEQPGHAEKHTHMGQLYCNTSPQKTESDPSELNLGVHGLR